MEKRKCRRTQIPHENVYIRNIPTKNARNHGNLTQTELRNTRKSYKFQEKSALAYVFEKNVGKPLISVEGL